MERKEKIWLGILILIAIAFNAFTLSPLIPWQEWRLWSNPEPDKSFAVEFGDYEINLPATGIQAKVGEYVEFIATSRDVTYGFGVFQPDGKLVFQMQVIPGHENQFLWKFEAPGRYDIRSTEYSGPRHPEMFIQGAIEIEM
ncbi:MAG: hypothetical protein A2Z15_08450 [Chloroflexi bacterium RBG_16_50_11]|nr:MAG: hypothetical protein A2Z15_08450 [Chloroflexi bacterium RBG_16_50_11]